MKCGKSETDGNGIYEEGRRERMTNRSGCRGMYGKGGNYRTTRSIVEGFMGRGIQTKTLLYLLIMGGVCK